MLHAIFSIDPVYELTIELSTESVAAATNLIEVCNEDTKIMAGRSSSSPDSMSCKCPIVIHISSIIQVQITCYLQLRALHSCFMMQ